MMKKEFEELTGVFLPSEMYTKVIEPAYMESKMDKHEFCLRYRQNKDGLAQKLQDSMELMLWKQKEDSEADRNGQELLVQQAREKIKDLTKRLEAEQEWKPGIPKGIYEGYAIMAADPLCHKIDEKRAKEFVAAEFGFALEKVKILTSMPQYEINRHGVIRKTEAPALSREPLCCAGDYNYILFQVSGQDYECVNGHLYVVDL